MTTINLAHTFAIRLFNSLFSKKSKSTKSVETTPVNNYETINEIKGDIMDYDGMGNYGRFPCINK